MISQATSMRQMVRPKQGMLAAITALAAVMPLLLRSDVGQRAGLALCAALGLLTLAACSQTGGAAAILIFLAVLGGVRRWLIPVMGWPANDPLLLVGPVVAASVFAAAVLRRILPRKDGLSRLILALTALMALEIFNPAQGGISIGLAGALFYIVPLLWYVYGATRGSEAFLQRLFLGAAVLAVFAAAYGLAQMEFGFAPSEQEWIDTSGYGALHVGSAMRPFSFFTSSAEYVTFLGVGIVVCWAAWLRGRRWALLPLPLLGAALFLDSVRGTLVLTVIACAVLWAIQSGNICAWLPRGLLALAMAAGICAWGLNYVQDAQFDSSVQSLVSHETDGLLDPLNSDQSTATLHTNMALTGLTDGFSHPLGQGLGATTQAASKFGASGGSMEVDVSNMFLSLGLFGGLVYCGVIFCALRLALRTWRRERSWTTLCLVGVMLVEMGQWLTGGQYSTAMLVWTALGSVKRMEANTEEKFTDETSHCYAQRHSQRRSRTGEL